MRRLETKRMAQLLAACGVLAVISATAWAAADKAKPADQTKKYVRPTDPSLYVGSETCKRCHADMPSKGFDKTFEDSPHFMTTLETKKEPGL